MTEPKPDDKRIPQWLQERRQATIDAVGRWSERSFQAKLRAFLGQEPEPEDEPEQTD